MKNSNLKAVVNYLYEDEIKDFECFVCDHEMIDESELIDGRVPINRLVELARENQDWNHVFVHVQALADFVDEK